jgi:DHA1 family inner membrane transport protein
MRWELPWQQEVPPWSLNVSAATLGQISSASSFLSIIIAIVMGVLVVRYGQKLLLSLGLGLICVAIVGTSASTSYISILVFYSFVGIGYSMVSPMVTTYIGQLYQPEGRTEVMGRLISIRSILSFLCPLITGYILAFSGWRIAFSSFNLPLTAISLILVLVAIPREVYEKVEKQDQLAGISAVLRNSSALAFLIAGALAVTPFIAIQVYNGTYLRQSYGLSVELVSRLMPLTAISVTLGLLISNRLVERLGLKKVVYLSTLVCAISYLVYFGAGLGLIPAVLFSLVGAVTTGVWLASSSALGLLQENVCSGSMMSLITASQNFGGVLGALLGGFALSSYGFIGLGSITSVLAIFATIIYLIWVTKQ